MRTTKFMATVAALLVGLLVLLPSAIAAPETSTAAPPVKGQYTTEVDAKSNCAADTVVWVNLSSKIYHASSSRSYGKTKSGVYMCQKDAAIAGYRAPKPRVAAKTKTA